LLTGIFTELKLTLKTGLAGKLITDIQTYL